MSAPTSAVWSAVKLRDNNECVMCFRRHSLTFQHRKATGSGGSKIRPTVEEGLTLCMRCNAAVESDRQAEAIECGWKVRFKRENCPLIPVFYPRDLAWFKFVGNLRIQISDIEAGRMFQSAYGKAA